MITHMLHTYILHKALHTDMTLTKDDCQNLQKRNLQIKARKIYKKRKTRIERSVIRRDNAAMIGAGIGGQVSDQSRILTVSDHYSYHSSVGT